MKNNDYENARRLKKEIDEMLKMLESIEKTNDYKEWFEEKYIKGEA